MKPMRPSSASVCINERRLKVLRWADFAICAAWMLMLGVMILTSGRANIQTDSIDYYAIVQRLTQDDQKPIVRNLHFLEQRSPGYPLLSLIPYHTTSVLVEPLVQTERIRPPSSPVRDGPDQRVTERALLPSDPLLFREVFFKDFYIESEDSWFEWKIISSMLITSYALLFLGLFFSVATLALDGDSILGASLAPLVVLTSSIFMHNIVNTPAYATLAAFGLSSIFTYFFVRGSLHNVSAAQILAGLFLGFLVLARLETVVILATLLILLILIKDYGFARNLVLGSLVAFVVLLLYNLSQFGTPIHLGILRGDINLIGLDTDYIYANLFNPRSGIVFWSTLATLGMAGLFLDGKRHTTLLGICSIALLALLLVRVPIMYNCIGEGMAEIGGLPVRCPANMADALTLVRFDANRYITVVIPFSILGLRGLAILVRDFLHRSGLAKANT